MSIFQDIYDFVGLEKRSQEFENAFSTYLSEAEWGWELVKGHVLNLPLEARILELGAGPKILSASIASLGYEITALEPATSGFSIMKELGRVVDSFSALRAIEFVSSECTGEELSEIDSYDLAFSINVMEHVSNVEKTLDNVVASLKIGGLYVFVCPNYSFPFEPHFSTVTLISKQMTERFIRNRIIMNSTNHVQSTDLWNSLNWITAKQIRNWAKLRTDVKVDIKRNALNMYLGRSTGGEEFRRRHPLIARLSKLLIPIANSMPMFLIPVLEVRIQKISDTA